MCDAHYNSYDPTQPQMLSRNEIPIEKNQTQIVCNKIMKNS